MDIAGDHALLGRACGLLRRRRNALLAQHPFAFAQVALGLHQRRFAFHHPRPGSFPELFYKLCTNLHRVLLMAVVGQAGSLRPVVTGLRAATDSSTKLLPPLRTRAPYAAAKPKADPLR